MIEPSNFSALVNAALGGTARGVGAAMIMPAANTEAMNEHLNQISAKVALGDAVLVCDGAGWHQRGRKLQVPDTITLLSLLPYSPELNPMENVWAYPRQTKLCALVWDIQRYPRGLSKRMALLDRNSQAVG